MLRHRLEGIRHHLRDSVLAVYVVVPSRTVRTQVRRLLGSIDVEVHAFPDASQLLGAWSPERCGCLVLDVRLPGLSGFELYQVVLERDGVIPVIFTCEDPEVATVIQAFKCGAADFLPLPLSHEALLDAVRRALRVVEPRRRRDAAQREARRQIGTLTPRERQVAALVAAGRANREIATLLELSPKTVEMHRRHAMSKLDARRLVDLVHVWSAAHCPYAGEGLGTCMIAQADDLGKRSASSSTD